ncbi:hypothetical protein TWF481_010066 [Arthrobotrys musiformis]|uniref:Uncharacterized protein n=1 Tax=Arthrobotrys musiformis TaxID=47236 RepID=A0AAV9VZX0_9PEZI
MNQLEKSPYDPTLRLEHDSSPEEKRHETLRITFTYALLNIVSIALIHLLVSPILAPHEFNQAVNSKVGMIVFKIFCAIWTLITAFYNCVLGTYSITRLYRKWEREEAESHWNRYRDPKGEINEEREDDGDDKTEDWGEAGPGSKSWFMNNNPYTAARRTHSGQFAAVRRSRRLSQPMEPYRLHAEHEPIMEETGDGDIVDAVATEEDFNHWKEQAEDRRVSFPNLKSPGEGSVSRHAEAYPFPKDEPDTAHSSTTTWSNSATSAGEFARKRKKGKGKKKGKKKEERPKEGLECSSPTCRKARYGDASASSGSSSWNLCANCSSSSTPSWEKEKHPKARRMANPNSQSLSGSGEGSSKQQSEASRDQDATGDTSDEEDEPERKPSQKSKSGASSDREDSDYEPVLEQTRVMKDIMTHGSYYDQQAALQHMNTAIWAEVGDHMERRVEIQEPAPPAKDSRGEMAKPPRWWSFRRRNHPLSAPDADVEMAELKEHQSELVSYPDATKGEQPESNPRTPNIHKTKETRKRRLLIGLILTICAVMTVFPPFIAIGGDVIAHDYQFHHACDQARWDIQLDASGLHPEQDNRYNRAIFKDRRGKGYEKEFMMNLEGMSTYGNGLDLSLVNQRRGYVFYLSKKDLANQPAGGESVRFPYPVVVAYDMLKHAYYAHHDISRDLNDEGFFDNGAFMNGTLGIFPSESIWLEKKENDGYCGQPKRVLKNGADQRIIWTVVDDRKDCTVLRVCASNKATRRQVVVATGMILLRLALSATCCSGKAGDSGPQGTS